MAFEIEMHGIKLNEIDLQPFEALGNSLEEATEAIKKFGDTLQNSNKMLNFECTFEPGELEICSQETSEISIVVYPRPLKSKKKRIVKKWDKKYSKYFKSITEMRKVSDDCMEITLELK